MLNVLKKTGMVIASIPLAYLLGGYGFEILEYGTWMTWFLNDTVIDALRWIVRFICWAIMLKIIFERDPGPRMLAPGKRSGP